MFLEKFGPFIFVHAISALLIFPGAVLVNFAGQRFLPTRTWTDDRRRPRLAGWLSVPIVWGVCVLSVVFEIKPARFLSENCGWIEAEILHIAGLTIVGSTLSLALGWALPPKPPAPRRP